MSHPTPVAAALFRLHSRDEFIEKAQTTSSQYSGELESVYKKFKSNNDIKELLDNNLKLEYFENFLIGLEVRYSPLYGKKIHAIMDKKFDENFVTVLQKYAKEEVAVLELNILSNFDKLLRSISLSEVIIKIFSIKNLFF